MKTADILVIGGGIAGLSVAARLAGNAQVIVLEMEERTGYHATGRSAAVFILNYGNAVLRALNAASWAHLSDGGYLRQRGELLVALPGQEAHIDEHLALGGTLERVDAAGLRDLLPIIREGRFVGGAYEREAHDIDVDRLLQDFARAHRQAGGEVVTKAEVQTLRRVDNLWHAETAAGAYTAPIVVNAAGAWADAVAARGGLYPLGLAPLRRSAAIVPAGDHDTRSWPLVAGIAEDWYAKPEAGALMVSPAEEDPVQPHDAYPDEMVLAEGLHRFEQATTLEIRRVTHRWAGLRTFAPDRTPVVGFDPRTEGFFWLAGQGGYGVQTSPALSRLAADLLMSNVSGLPEPVLRSMSPIRFTN